MNGFNLSEASDIKLGSSTITALYLGSSKLWPLKHDYSKDYFTVEALESACEVQLSQVGTWANDYIISYSTNGGTSWQLAVWGNLTADLKISLSLGDTLMIRGSNGPLATDSSHYHKIYATKKIKVYGNISYLSSNSDTTISLDKDYYYAYLFYNCDKLVDASNLILPATTLADSCYRNMFYGCTSLTAAPELPATKLAGYCYAYMFHSCTSLTAPPELPATILANGCYAYMFHSCTSLTAPPELPATKLAGYCYAYMFHSCTSLTAPPELPATILANGCYAYMFEGCSSLTTAPELPATTLAASCYMSMFSATKITAAPTLPATTLADSCYRNMFYGCSSLATAPVLPATTLQSRCYQHMFFGCSSLTAAPELPATTLVDYCYGWMFNRCTSLSYIKCLATNISAQNSHTSWVYNVAATGTFVKPSSMTSWTSGTSGIPSRWTVTNI